MPAAAPVVGSLISATFSQLPQAQPASAAAVASAVAAAAPAMHVVKTTTIRVDPDPPAVQQAVPLAMASDAASPAVAAVPAVVAVAAHDVVANAPDASPVPMGPPSKAALAKAKAAAKPAPAHGGGQMKVGGAGVTVRTGPSKAKSQLFNLAAGQKVTIGGRQRGWVQVTDSQGRAGWVYSELLRKL